MFYLLLLKKCTLAKAKIISFYLTPDLSLGLSQEVINLALANGYFIDPNSYINNIDLKTA